LANLSRRIPPSGLAYQWTREPGGGNLAWWAGWLMIIQVTAGLAALCYPLASYALPAIGIAASASNVVIATSLILFSIALINHSGVKTTRGAAWTITGFEGAANLAEETKLPEKRVPFAILSAEVFSVVIGFLILLGFTLAIPSLEAATQDAVPFARIMDHHFPHFFTTIVMFIMVAEIYACVLANSAMLMRVAGVMARDHQLPVSRWLSRISSRKMPANSLGLMTVLTAVYAWWANWWSLLPASQALLPTSPTSWGWGARCSVEVHRE
jgi:amino acid transporter